MPRATSQRPSPPARRVPLKVLRSRPPGSGRAIPRRSRVARWRAAALILVYLLMTAHVLHWWITGHSLGRIVLSDSMKTLELGEINPGFLFFIAALLVTALLGRFMCGWVCHIGALQDLSAWILRRLGVRPRLFRARLLGYVPLALAAYMFLWPTLKREAIVPLAQTLWPGAAAALHVRPFPGWSLDLGTERLWDGLPSLAVAIPFLLLCGFATVYFLGARGLCRYACPYGGFLLPVEQLAPGRVVVDPALCDQCGLCTAACSAGVRVHDEVRLAGAVLDRNCVRSFDCVGACPQRALSFRLAPPAFTQRATAPRRRFDLTWPEELLCLAVFAVTFFVLRGLYDLIPLLMAVPLAAIAAFLVWKCLRLAREPNVRLGVTQLRLRGRITLPGHVALLVLCAVAALFVHAALVRVLLWDAARYDDRVQVGFDAALTQQGVTPADRESAATALRLYRLASPLSRGGIALAQTPDAATRIAWLEIVAGRPGVAADELEALIRSGRAPDGIGAELAMLLSKLGEQERAVHTLQDLLAARPGFALSRDALAGLLMQSGRAADAEALYRRALAGGRRDALARAGLGRVLLSTGRADEGLAELTAAARASPREPGVQRDRAIALYVLGRVDEAVRSLETAARARPAARAELLGLAANLLHDAGRPDDARAMLRRANAERPS